MIPEGRRYIGSGHRPRTSVGRLVERGLGLRLEVLDCLFWDYGVDGILAPFIFLLCVNHAYDLLPRSLYEVQGAGKRRRRGLKM